MNLTDRDRSIIARARELAALKDVDAIAAATDTADSAHAISIALGQAQYVLTELAAIAERGRTAMSTDYPIDRLQRLSEAEQAYIARWIVATHPDLGEQGLDALAAYRRDHADTARLLLGPETEMTP